jgi:aryl-alcohol dehydrogenase-like predicted oxidoreductase
VLVERVRAIAGRKGVKAGQLALAWVLAQGDDVVPIPGTKRRTYLEENAAAADIQLTAEEIAELEAAVPRDEVAGDRYIPSAMKVIDR